MCVCVRACVRVRAGVHVCARAGGRACVCACGHAVVRVRVPACVLIALTDHLFQNFSCIQIRLCSLI